MGKSSTNLKLRETAALSAETRGLVSQKDQLNAVEADKSSDEAKYPLLNRRREADAESEPSPAKATRRVPKGRKVCAEAGKSLSKEAAKKMSQDRYSIASKLSKLPGKTASNLSSDQRRDVEPGTHSDEAFDDVPTGRWQNAESEQCRAEANGVVPQGQMTDTEARNIHEDGGHFTDDTLRRHASVLVNQIQQTWRQRQDLHRAEKSLTLQIKSICRRACGGDKGEAALLYDAITGSGEHSKAIFTTSACLPFFAAIEAIRPMRLGHEKTLAILAAQLPVVDFVEQTGGFGLLSLAAIVGEAGDLSNYASVARLWKRMGLAVFDGQCQRKHKDKEMAELYGYSPIRRSVMWVIGDTMIKSQSAIVPKPESKVVRLPRAAGPYRVLYDERKLYELTKLTNVAKPNGIAHNRAKRYVEKRLLRNLWRAWRDTEVRQ